jgi:hypothetical protein
MSKRLAGVTLIAVLTLLGSGALFLLFVTSSLVLVVGGPGSGGFDWLYVMLHYPTVPVSLILSVYAFFLSICMFVLTSKYVWHASVLFWLVSLVFFSWWSYGIWRNVGLSYNENGSTTWELVYAWQYEIVLVTLLPFVYSIGCLLYFQTAKVKNYFRINIL